MSSVTATRLPTFIVMGAMKGGTTSLFRYLKVHPEICCSSVKETNFFGVEFERGLDWYQSLFERDAPALGEASPNYTTSGRIPSAVIAQRMHAQLPAVKLIYVLRDPVERMVSHYWHGVEKQREQRDMISAITADTATNGYLRASRYFEQLECYLRYFDQRQILLLSSEELLTRTRTTMRRVFEFIGVNPHIDSNRFDQAFHRTADKETFQPTFWDRLNLAWARQLENSYFRRWMPQAWRKTRSKHLLSLDRRTKASLIERLAKDVQRLRDFSGMRFPEWCL